MLGRGQKGGIKIFAKGQLWTYIDIHSHLYNFV